MISKFYVFRFLLYKNSQYRSLTQRSARFDKILSATTVVTTTTIATTTHKRSRLQNLGELERAGTTISSRSLW